jgi:hypothetical protein
MAGGAASQVKMPRPRERTGDGAYSLYGLGSVFRSRLSMSAFESFDGVLRCVDAAICRPLGRFSKTCERDRARKGIRETDDRSGTSDSCCWYPSWNTCASNGRLTVANMPNRAHTAILNCMSAVSSGTVAAYCRWTRASESDKVWRRHTLVYEHRHIRQPRRLPRSSKDLGSSNPCS